MSELLEKIRSRGYWKVIIRPATFVEKRVTHISDLLPILERTSVNLKGWSFPHIDSFGALDKGPDWIGQEFSWDSIVELWRFYQSGQFVHYFGMPEDRSANYHSRWLPSNDEVHRVILDVKSSVLQFTEIFEFATRLTFSDAGDNVMRLTIAADNIKEHYLKLPEFSPEKGPWIPQAHKPLMEYTEDLSRIQLTSETKELALKAALKLFGCFQWNPGPEILRDLQGEFLHGGPAVSWQK
jgi:hypothetical protein